MMWLEAGLYRARAIDGRPEEQPPYRAMGIVHVFGDVAVMAGLCGRLRRGDFEAFCRELRLRGIDWLVAERTDGHRLPHGEKIAAPGPFQGWYVVELSKFDEAIMESMG